MATPPHPVLTRIHEADRLIIAEAFDPLMDHYTEDAVLILEPGQEVRGRDAIRHTPGHGEDRGFREPARRAFRL